MFKSGISGKIHNYDTIIVNNMLWKYFYFNMVNSKKYKIQIAEAIESQKIKERM